MKLKALKTLPNGIQEGEVFDEIAVRGRILILLGHAEETEPDAADLPSPSRRRTYRRRDLQADE